MILERFHAIYIYKHLFEASCFYIYKQDIYLDLSLLRLLYLDLLIYLLYKSYR